MIYKNVDFFYSFIMTIIASLIGVKISKSANNNFTTWDLIEPKEGFLMDSISQPALLIDSDRVFQNANKQMLDTFKLDIKDLKNRCISDMTQEILIVIDVLLDGIVREDTISIEIENDIKFYKINISSINDNKHNKTGYLITFVEVTSSNIIETAII